MSYSGTKQIRVFPLGRWDVWSCVGSTFRTASSTSDVNQQSGALAVMSINNGEHRLHFVTSLGRALQPDGTTL